MEPVEIYNALCINDHPLKPWRTFIYIDCAEYLAGKSFEKYGLNPFILREMSSDGEKYIALSCIIKKKNTGLFCEAMAELQKNMVICGYLDYEQFCRELVADVTEEDDADAE